MAVAKRGTIGRPKTNPTPTPNAIVTWRRATRVFNYGATIFTTRSNKCTTHLSVSKDTLDTESLAKLEDIIVGVTPTHSTPPTFSTVAASSSSKPDPSNEVRELRKLVSQLTTTINNFSLNFSPSRHPRRSRSKSNTRRLASPHNHNERDRPNQEQDPPPHVCWYLLKTVLPNSKKLEISSILDNGKIVAAVHQ